MKKFFWRTRYSERGSVAIEAAVLLPLAVFMIFGFLELYNYHRAAAVLNRLSFTIANGVAMQPEIFDRGQCFNTDDICVYKTIANDLFQPLDYTSKGTIIISAYATTVPRRGGTVTWYSQPEWQKRYHGSGAGNVTATSRLNSSSFPPPRVDDTLIVAEVFYTHEPFVISSRFWSSLGGTTEMYSRFNFRPRFSDLRELTQ